jgi:asparagine synthase (glutamine-hydrolysing)
MCGIAGKISFNESNTFEQDVKSACQAMAYRGPDNTTINTIGNATLGHCRLAIIDLSAEANQPFLFRR